MKRMLALALVVLMVFSCGALAESVLNVTGSGAVYVAADRVSASMGISINGEDDGATTGVGSVETSVDEGNGDVYNLNGQKVGVSLKNLPRGLYIKNGKKIVVE